MKKTFAIVCTVAFLITLIPVCYAVPDTYFVPDIEYLWHQEFNEDTVGEGLYSQTNGEVPAYEYKVKEGQLYLKNTQKGTPRYYFNGSGKNMGIDISSCDVVCFEYKITMGDQTPNANWLFGIDGTDKNNSSVSDVVRVQSYGGDHVDFFARKSMKNQVESGNLYRPNKPRIVRRYMDRVNNTYSTYAYDENMKLIAKDENVTPHKDLGFSNSDIMAITTLSTTYGNDFAIDVKFDYLRIYDATLNVKSLNMDALVDSDAKITFSLPISKDSLGEIKTVDSNDNLVECEYVCDTEYPRIVNLHYKKGLKYNEEYKIKVSNQIKDYYGDNFCKEYETTFKTQKPPLCRTSHKEQISDNSFSVSTKIKNETGRVLELTAVALGYDSSGTIVNAKFEDITLDKTVDYSIDVATDARVQKTRLYFLDKQNNYDKIPVID